MTPHGYFEKFHATGIGAGFLLVQGSANAGPATAGGAEPSQAVNRVAPQVYMLEPSSSLSSFKMIRAMYPMSVPPD